MKNILKTLWGKSVTIGTGILVILGIIDYFVKWNIYPFILNTIIKPIIVFSLLNKIIVILCLLFVWILFLTIKIFPLLKIKILDSSDRDINSPNDYEEMKKSVKFLRDNAVSLKTGFDKEILSIKSKVSNLENDTYEVKREILENQANKHETLGQEGGILCRIELLELDSKENKDWRIHETLQTILKYLQKNSVFSDSATRLKKTLEKLPAEYDLIKKQIIDSIKFH